MSFETLQWIWLFFQLRRSFPSTAHPQPIVRLAWLPKQNRQSDPHQRHIRIHPPQPHALVAVPIFEFAAVPIDPVPIQIFPPPRIVCIVRFLSSFGQSCPSP